MLISKAIFIDLNLGFYNRWALFNISGSPLTSLWRSNKLETKLNLPSKFCHSQKRRGTENWWENGGER
jgi:hypothetical protein